MLHYLERIEILINDAEFGSFNFLQLKYRKEEQIIEPFYRTVLPQEIWSSHLNLRNFEKLRKGLLDNAEWIEM